MTQKHAHSPMGGFASRRDRGFAIVAVTLLMATAVVLSTAMTLETSRKLKMVRLTESDINAKLMARSGIERGIVEVAASMTGYNGTPMTEMAFRRVYMVDTPVRTNDRVELMSIGVADGIAQRINAVVAIENGVSGVFDKVIYAGNVPPDPEDRDNPPPENLAYSLDFGGEGGEADRIDGDIYSGGDVEADGDATISPAIEETFTDTNGNGLYDRGDLLNIDINGNGVFDADVSETYTDANGNGVYDEGEDFSDMNDNDTFDAAEEFTDYDHDNVFDPAEPFNDANNNGRYDYGIEATGEVDYDDVPEAEGSDDRLAPPDLLAADYESSADINVAARYGDTESGILPKDDAAHIFVKNPHDGRDSIVDQVFDLDGQQVNPDDYFLEDPHEKIETGSPDSSAGATPISLADGSGKNEEDGNHKVYFIDGNLYLHNRSTYSFQLKGPKNEGITATFVVRGNIVLSDNFYYQNKNKDQIAFIAMRREDDPKGEISGNIYIGDEEFGTVASLDCMLYAENNFYDNNLDEEGSQHFEIYGSMTAGNQIRINRDYEIPGHYEWRRVRGQWQQIWVEGEKRHSSMTIIADDRYADGANGRERLVPGLPTGPRRDGAMSIRVASTEHVGRADVPQEYYAMYGENSGVKYDN